MEAPVEAGIWKDHCIKNPPAIAGELCFYNSVIQFNTLLSFSVLIFFRSVILL